MEKIARIPFFFSLFRRLCRLSTAKIFGPAGWTFEWKCNTKSCVAWDCKRCFYADVFNEYGMPELTKIFCESDDVVYGALPGIRWGRTKTIGNGADVCGFCFCKEKRPARGKRSSE